MISVGTGLALVASEAGGPTLTAGLGAVPPAGADSTAALSGGSWVCASTVRACIAGILW